MKKNIRKILYLSLFILLNSIIYKNVYAEDYLIKVGTGTKQITVTNQTKINQIISVLGKPKVETPSAFGGTAYTFYTDENYSNYLYIETTSDGTIASYGSVDPSYKTNTYSYDDAYNYKENGVLHGLLMNFGGKIKGGVYYNKYNIFNGSYNETVSFYENTYKSDENTYLKSLIEHSIPMFNALSTNQGYKTNLIFDEDYFYMNQQLKEFGSSIKTYFEKTDQANYYKGIKLKEKVGFTNSVYYILNPGIIASLCSYSFGTDFSQKNIAIFDYNMDTKIITTGAIAKDAFAIKNKISYTTKEIDKLQKGRALYKKAIDNLYVENKIYKIEPQTKIASQLVAGELVDSKKIGILQYVNSIRIAAGLSELELDEHAYDVSQHIATLISYRKTELGLDITHIPAKPDGVTQDYYEKSLGVSDGYAENLGYSANETSTDIMMHHMNMFLDDGAERPQNFSHRTKVLDTEFTKFGYGISNLTFANEFSGYKASDVKLQAWPAEGVTFLESLVDKRFKWTAQFVKQYKVQDTTTVTVKCLNTNQEWNWLNEEGTTSSNRYFTRYTKSLSSINNKVVFYDNTIVPQEGYVYEITIHNLLDENTNKNTDYKYRTVFENANENNSEKQITGINIEVPSSLEMINNGTYKAQVGNKYKLNAKIVTTGTTEKMKLVWKSSDSSKVEVTQNGIINIKEIITRPVVIELVDEYSNLKKNISILTETKGISMNIETTKYQLNERLEKLQLNAKLSNGQIVQATWKSSNNKIATIDQNGVVIAQKGGYVKITATTGFGSDSVLLYINLLRDLSDGSKAYPGDLNGDGAINSVDASIASDWYNKGNLTEDEIALGDLNGDGTVNSIDASIISDIYNGGGQFQIGEYIHITSININNSNVTLEKAGDKIQLSVTTSPTDTTDSPIIKWVSGNTNVVKVDENGLVTAVGGGTTTITAIANNGKGVKKSINITVKGPAIEYSKNGIYYNEEKNVWEYYKNNKVDYSYSGVATNNQGIWYIDKGIITFKHYEVILHNNKWMSFRKSKFDKNYTGLGNNAQGTWYVKNGIVDFKYNGTYKDSNNNIYIMKNSKVNTNVTEVRSVNNVWYYFEKGKTNYKYTGLGKNSLGTWYVKKGIVDFKFTGSYTDLKGKKYRIKYSKVIS